MGAANAGDIALDGTTTAGLALVIDTVHGIYQTWKSPLETHQEEMADDTLRDGPPGDMGGQQKNVAQELPLQRLSDTNGATFTLGDVAKHDSPDDCWIIVKNKVYDVSEFGKRHPGGSVLYTQAGRDATDIFSVFHATKTWNLLKKYEIGAVAKQGSTSDLLHDFREVRAAFLREGLFRSSKLYYTFKCLCNLAILLASIYLIWSSDAYTSLFISAALLGLFWQQTGWLAHDFLHHQVFEQRWLNNVFGGYIMGNLLQGLSFEWWKAKHNKHHAAPNQTDDDYLAVDPDIDTLPLLAWSKDVLVHLNSSIERTLIRWQAYLFFPILLFARCSWVHSSLMWSISSRELSGKRKLLDVGTLGLHFLLFLVIAFCCLPPVQAVLWLFSAQLMGGFMLSIVFVQSHNGMEVYNDNKDFVSAQVVSTRDIHGGIFNDWYTGGLNRQIEHHLFPSMPRHNLGKAASMVQALCQKHGLVYEDVSMGTGTWRVLERLADVAAAA